MELKNKEFREHECGLFVASDGEVFVPSGSRGRNEHFTFGCDNGKGYLLVGRNRKLYQVHRLVAECFIPNPDNLPTVDHVDRNPSNNNVENLRWADMSLQQYNSVKPNNNAKSKKVLQLTLDGELVKEWPSTRECDRNGFNCGHVAACCRGERKSHKDYIWRYK